MLILVSEFCCLRLAPTFTTNYNQRISCNSFFLFYDIFSFCNSCIWWTRLRCIIYGTPNFCVRFNFWRWCTLNSPSLLSSCHTPTNNIHVTKEKYLELASLESNLVATCYSTGQLGEIMRDVNRTFPSHVLFQGLKRGEKMLSRILKAIATHLPDVGFCQVGVQLEILTNR